MASVPLVIDPGRCFAALRISAALALIYYGVVIVLPQFSLLYGAGGMVRPELFSHYGASPLFALWESPRVLRALYALLMGALCCFALGYKARWAQLVAAPLLIVFHHGNPFIIHEPQQLSNLLFLLLFFAPIEQHLCIAPSFRLRFFEGGGELYQRRLAFLLLAYLATYYFAAGLKKLPDPAWLDGDALGLLVQWPPLYSDGVVAETLRSHPTLATVGTYLTLLFELGFAALAFSRWRRLLIPMGLCFHLATAMTLDVGHFAVAMIAWYPLLGVSGPNSVLGLRQLR